MPAASWPDAPVPPGVELRYVAGDDPLMSDVAMLCYETLHRPFAVSRDDRWDNLDPASTHLVALVDGGVVGYARLIVEGGWGHIRQLAVYEDRRGQGIGSALMVALLSRAGDMRLPRVYLNARLTAVGLYERLGFVSVGGVFEMPRTYLPHVRMELDLR